MLVINAQRFDHNRIKKSRLLYFIPVLVTLSVIGLITYGFIPSKTIFNNDTIRFSGMYGFEINMSEIETVALTDKLPRIKMRTNGLSVGAVKKGFFTLDKYGKSRLLVHSDLPPYIILSKKNGDKIVINFKDNTETVNVYNKMKVLNNEPAQKSQK